MRGVTNASAAVYVEGEFQPALPMRGVTYDFVVTIADKLISTRTPHAGSDRDVGICRCGYHDFNPHSPCGE